MTPTSRLAVRLQPRAKRNEIDGERAGALLVRVAAPPVEGRANEALRKLLAKRLRVPRGAVTVVSGESGRDKVIEVEGLDEAELRRRLGLPPTPGVPPGAGSRADDHADHCHARPARSPTVYRSFM